VNEFDEVVIDIISEAMKGHHGPAGFVTGYVLVAHVATGVDGEDHFVAMATHENQSWVETLGLLTAGSQQLTMELHREREGD
jgi:hypothetical protein